MLPVRMAAIKAIVRLARRIEVLVDDGNVWVMGVHLVLPMTITPAKGHGITDMMPDHRHVISIALYSRT